MTRSFASHSLLRTSDSCNWARGVRRQQAVERVGLVPYIPPLAAAMERAWLSRKPHVRRKGASAVRMASNRSCAQLQAQHAPPLPRIAAQDRARGWPPGCGRAGRRAALKVYSTNKCGIHFGAG